MVIPIYEHYEQVQEHGCDKNCEMCDLFLLSRKECALIAEKKWQRWADERHKKFGEVLNG